MYSSVARAQNPPCLNRLSRCLGFHSDHSRFELIQVTEDIVPDTDLFHEYMKHIRKYTIVQIVINSSFKMFDATNIKISLQSKQGAYRLYK